MEASFIKEKHLTNAVFHTELMTARTLVCVCQNNQVGKCQNKIVGGYTIIRQACPL